MTHQDSSEKEKDHQGIRQNQSPTYSNCPDGPPSRKIIKFCFVCGIAFRRYPSNCELKYCSRECYRVGIRKTNRIHCKQCGNKFLVSNHRKNAAKFCSNNCYYLYMKINHVKIKKVARIDITCLNCETVFKVVPARKDYAKYCSVACAKAHTGSRTCIVCKCCGKDILIPASALKYGRKFCSAECYHNRNGQKIKRLCGFCGKEFKVFQCKSGERKFCSQQCYWDSRKIRVEMKCETCGKLYLDHTWESKKSRYCSLKCFSTARSQKINLLCDYCGIKFKRTKNEVDRYKEHFCSTDCRSSAHSMLKKCIYCGRNFKVDKNIVARGWGNHCSKSCARKSQWLNEGWAISIANSLKKALKECWANYTEEEKSDRLTKMAQGLMVLPNKPETKLIEIFEKRNLPFRYVGDKQFWIHYRNPDFICTSSGVKLVLEHFGIWWHDQKVNRNVGNHLTEEGTIAHYKKHGYACIVVWQPELDDEEKVVTKIKKALSECTAT